MLSVFASCEDNNETPECAINESSTEEISILKQSIAEADEYTYFMKATYQGQAVYFNRNCDPLIDYQSNVYDCEGTFIGYTGELAAELSNVSLLWKHPQSMCATFN